jgi:hypothetical protein
MIRGFEHSCQVLGHLFVKLGFWIYFWEKKPQNIKMMKTGRTPELGHLSFWILILSIK